MKRSLLACLAVAGMATALTAAAQFQKPEDAIKYRKSGMFLLGQHFGRIGAMVNGKAPFDAKAAAENAELAAMLGKLPFAGFVPGSEQGGDTTAKPEIWSQADKFKAAADKMHEAMGKLSAAAKTGNQDQIKTAFGAAAQTCKGCHDDFRVKR